MPYCTRLVIAPQALGCLLWKESPDGTRVTGTHGDRPALGTLSPHTPGTNRPQLVLTSPNRYQLAPTGTGQNKPAPAARLLQGVKGRHKMSALLHHPQQEVAKPARV